MKRACDMKMRRPDHHRTRSLNLGYLFIHPDDPCTQIAVGMVQSVCWLRWSDDSRLNSIPTVSVTAQKSWRSLWLCSSFMPRPWPCFHSPLPSTFLYIHACNTPSSKWPIIYPDPQSSHLHLCDTPSAHWPNMHTYINKLKHAYSHRTHTHTSQTCTKI